MEREPLHEEGERVIKLTIPDEEIKKWEKTLQDGGFSEQEIHHILALKNKNYAEEHLGGLLEENGDQFAIDQEMEEISAEFRRLTGRDMTPEEREKRENAFSEVFKKMESISNLPEDQLLETNPDFLEKLNRRIDDEERKTGKGKKT